MHPVAESQTSSVQASLSSQLSGAGVSHVPWAEQVPAGRKLAPSALHVASLQGSPAQAAGAGWVWVRHAWVWISQVATVSLPWQELVGSGQEGGTASSAQSASSWQQVMGSPSPLSSVWPSQSLSCPSHSVSSAS